jgi:hypothetical protein
MRGFPLLSALLVATVFAVSWWPLRQAMTGDATPVVSEPMDARQGNSRPASLEIHATAPILSLRVEHLGSAVIDLPGGVSGKMSHNFPALDIPPEGIELWIDARLEPGKSTNRSALAVEVRPEGSEPITVTLWSDEYGAIDGGALFVWKPE